jgi:hypothetical protein
LVSKPAASVLPRPAILGECFAARATLRKQPNKNAPPREY